MIALVLTVIFLLQERRIERIRHRINIDENGHGAQLNNRLRGGDKRHGGDDHFIAGFDVQRAQRQKNGIRSGIDADGLFHLRVSGQFFFKSGGFRA